MHGHALRLGAATVTAIFLLFTLVGCGTQALAPTVTTAAAATPVAPPRTEVGCIDTTTSVPTQFIEAAREWIARRVADAVPGPMGSATFYLRLTTSASYSARSAVQTVVIPALAPAPDPLPEPQNPFETVERERIAAENQRAVRAWQQRLDEARSSAAHEADAVRTTPLPVDDKATDVLGCVVKAAELLDAPGDRMLFVAGDLAPTGPQSAATADLGGAPVVVAVWCVDDTTTCVDRRERFLTVLRDLNAGPITVLDAQQIP